LALRASVGLTVLAPSPLTWDPGTIDILFEAADDGVFAIVATAFVLAGDLAARDEDLL